MSPSTPGQHPSPPPSEAVRAAQSRLIERLLGPEEATAEARASRSPSASSVAPNSDDPTVERYAFGEVFATGGLGVIRRARDRRLDREVAVKELRRADPEAERRFMSEATLTARLQHPGIVPIHDIGRFPDGEPFYCMKLIDGESLEERIARTADPRERLALLEHVVAAADAVAYAHHRGVIHRDLKPANILVGEHGETVVIDWGLARELEGRQHPEVTSREPPGDPRATLTAAGSLVGTPRYMAPEQARGEPADRRSDVFALGAVLFQVLSGRAPDDALERELLLNRRAAGELERLDLKFAKVPTELRAIVHKAMSPAPSDRYCDAAAFAEDLRRFLGGELVRAHRYGARDLARLYLGRYRGVVAAICFGLVALMSMAAIFVVELRRERDQAEAARGHAELAEITARRRGDAAVLARASAVLHEDLVAAIDLIDEVDLGDATNLRRARLVALEAAARGAPDQVLRGHSRTIESLAPLADGGLVTVDVAGEVWRWDLNAGAGHRVGDLGVARAQVVAAAEAPVWAAVGAHHGFVVRGDEAPVSIDLGELDASRFTHASAIGTHRWELSRHGEVLAALGNAVHVAGETFAAAYLWDLRVTPPRRRALPFDHVSATAMSPDGAAVALPDPPRGVVVIEGDARTEIAALTRVRGWSASGRFIVGPAADAPRETIVWSRSDGGVRRLSGVVQAITRDDAALILEPSRAERAHIPRRLALRDLTTGDARWTAEVDESQDFVAALAWGFALADRGDRFALRIGDTWQIWSMEEGSPVRSLRIGAEHPAVFLRDGAFASARGSELWIWSDPLAHPLSTSAWSIAADGSHAIIRSPTSKEPRVLRLADRRESPIPCLDRWTVELALAPRSRFAVDRRGRALVVDDQGRACLSLDAGEHRILDLPAHASAVALADASEAFAVGTSDGTVLAWADLTAHPKRWRLDAPVVQLWMLPGAEAIFAHTEAGALAVLVADRETPIVLGASAPDRGGRGPRVVAHPRRPAAAITLPDESLLLVHDPLTGATSRRSLTLAERPAIAFSPSGAGLAVALADRRVLVLEAPGAPGREIALPRPTVALTYVDEETLLALTDRGALHHVDLELGESALRRGEPSPWHAASPTLAVLPSGEVAVLDAGLVIEPPLSVLRDREEIEAWIRPRAPAHASP